MKKKKNRRRFPFALSCILILWGSGIVLFALYKSVEIVVDGESKTITAFSSRVINILQQAKIEYKPTDRIRPGLGEQIRDGGRISLNHGINVHLDPGNGLPPFSFITYQRFGGNILLDAGLRLYPGDRLMWKGTELRPDFNLAGIRELELKLEQAETFTLVTESDPDGKIAHGSGATVFDALLSAGISVSKSTLLIPDGDAPFESGMTIEVLPVRELLVSKDGTLTPLISSGATVGEALARAGMPLMGSDVSIPAAGEPLPADGRILVVPVRDAFTLHAESIRRETDWTANSDLSLDETKLIAEGKNGLRGTFSRERIENGEVVLNETSEEMVLVQPVNEKREYGTKINIQMIDTPEGPLEYYRAVKVYATSYSPCRSGTGSCINGTSSGMKVQKGVVAVTSSWYNQFGGQSVYVPDYGKAVIGDVGGGIPGRYWIDLAYEDDNFEGWSKETTLYFLTPVPTDMVWVLQ